MKTLKLVILLAFTLTSVSRAEEARFFRITGPVASAITAFSADGYVTWSNAPINATFTVQTASSLRSPTNWGDSANWVDYVEVPVTSEVTTHRLYDPNPPAGMALIPAGSFTMGNAMTSEGNTDELPLHSVYVSAFYMDRYDVAKALWLDVENWALTHGYTFSYDAGSGKEANHPVQRTDWYDSVKWCNARSEKENKVPAYYTDAGLSVRYRSGEVAPYVNWGSRGYRLPTEAEWEKAARGGASGHRFPLWSGSDNTWDNITHGSANYNSSASFAYDWSPTRGYHPTFNDGAYPYTSPVDYFEPNGYGLYDMAGNVRQWCWDWHGAYSPSAQSDPRGPAYGSYRVNRGGSWYNVASYCRAANRSGDYPTDGSYIIGFRSVLPRGQ